MAASGTGMRAFTRPVPDSIHRCELTHIGRAEIDLGLARLQHAAYEHALGQMGCVVLPLPAAHDMQVAHDVYVGVSGRTNAAGVRQLAEIAGPYGYRVHPVETRGCLHLKSAVTCIGDELLLVNPEWVEVAHFDGMRRIAIDPDEPFAANVVRVGDAVLCADAAAKTRTRLERFGLDVRTVDLSELAKAEGALTCCSLILKG
jgi:N-dimethylarginine dimethylaminohydrolase